MNENPNEVQARLMYEVALYRQQLTMLQKEIERVSLTTIDLSNAISTIEQMKKEDMLVPIGGGTFIKAAVTNTNVLIPIGAQYMREIGEDEAAEELKKRKEATGKAIQRLEVEFKKIVEKFQTVSSQLQDMEAMTKINRQVDEGIREDYI